MSNSEGSMLEGVASIPETMESLLETVGVEKVYGEPVKEGETVLIPAAEVVALAGFGLGFGSGQSPAAEEAEGEGGGGGGGGKMFSRPVAVIVASPQGVRVEPVVDVTKVALAAITAAGFMLAAMLRMTSSRAALRQLKGE